MIPAVYFAWCLLVIRRRRSSCGTSCAVGVGLLHTIYRDGCVLPVLSHSCAVSPADVVCTTDYAVAFRDIDVALLVGARPRGPGMERKDLLQANAAIFKGQGEALDTHAKKSVRVLVVGNPANTNALIACHAAPSIPKSHVTCLTRLDLNRARAALAKRVGARPGDVTGCLIWGNHSTTQFPDARYAMVAGTDPVRPHDHASVSARLQQLEGAAGPAWLHSAAPDGFLPLIQGRGKAVIDKRGASSAGSAAQAICDHMRDWWCGSGGRMVCMGVHTSCLPLHPGTGQPVYAVPRDLIFSLPLVCEGVEPEESRRRIPATAPADGGAAVPGDACGYRIVTDLGLDDFTKGKLAETTKELLEERELALGIPQDA